MFSEGMPKKKKQAEAEPKAKPAEAKGRTLHLSASEARVLGLVWKGER